MNDSFLGRLRARMNGGEPLRRAFGAAMRDYRQGRCHSCGGTVIDGICRSCGTVQDDDDGDEDRMDRAPRYDTD